MLPLTLAAVVNAALVDSNEAPSRWVCMGYLALGCDIGRKGSKAS
jgi:hypothetical protein